MSRTPANSARRAGVAALTSAVVALGLLSSPVAEASPTRASATLTATVGALRGTATATTSFHLVAVGDIAREGGAQAATAAVVAGARPAGAAAAGRHGVRQRLGGDFASWYDPAYGRFRSISWPLPGNHEYRTANAAGFRTYFGVTGTTWWAKRAGAWLVLGLDSEKVGSAAQRAFVRGHAARQPGSADARRVAPAAVLLRRAPRPAQRRARCGSSCRATATSSSCSGGTTTTTSACSRP